MLVKVNSQLRIVCFIRIGQAQKPIETPPDVRLNEFVMKIRIIYYFGCAKYKEYCFAAKFISHRNISLFACMQCDLLLFGDFFFLFHNLLCLCNLNYEQNTHRLYLWR